ncbi:MAG TPA: DUF433 domain-containing protein [Polyangiaceae bacterium]|nr:DUF433 domain-containing protein [Polyangiaceae bacterium]
MPALDALPIILIPHPHVRVDRDVLGGSPYVAGSRVPVRRLWAFYQRGASVEVLVKRYPRLGPGKIFDALAFAFDNLEVIERDLLREQQILAEGEPQAKAHQMDLPFEGPQKMFVPKQKPAADKKPRRK